MAAPNDHKQPEGTDVHSVPDSGVDTGGESLNGPCSEQCDANRIDGCLDHACGSCDFVPALLKKQAS